MYFTDIFIRRPVFATVLSLIILLVGLRSFADLSVREYPNIEPTVITVSTTYSGANARLMEGFVTTPLENALGSVEGLDYMTSGSTQGSSHITVHFVLGHDINTSVADVTNAVSSVRSKLPSGIDDPVIAKEDPSANPTLFINFDSPSLSAEKITDYLTRVIQPQLQAVPGVGQVELYGGQDYAMRIWLDPRKMAARKITTNDVVNALNVNNVLSAPGKIEAPYEEIGVNATTDLHTAEQFDNLVIKSVLGSLIRVKDIGYAELGHPELRVSVRMSSSADKYKTSPNAVVIGIIPQPTANPLAVAQAVRKLMPSIEANLPEGLSTKILYDSSKFISESLKEVRKTIFEATFFVGLVILAFLGTFRAVLIPLVTIPLSIIGVCTFMLIMGYTINTLTLLAFVLAIGLVVDDAIVVLENIHRHIELGKTPFKAAIDATREIGFAVIAMTFTLASVYAPIGFLSDVTGKLFREFAFTLAGAVVVSGFIALTLSPMMSSKLLRHEINREGFVAKIDDLFTVLMEKYKRKLAVVLKNRKRFVWMAVFVYISAYFLYTTLPSELAPSEDQGYLLAIAFAPTSANLDYTAKYSSQIEKIYKSVPEMDSYGIINGIPEGVNTALSFIVFTPWSERKRTADEISQSLFMPLWSIPGIQAFSNNPPALPGASGNSPIAFVLKTTGTYEELNDTVTKMITTIQKENPKLTNINVDLKLDKPEVNVEIDRSKANLLGVSMDDIGNALNTFLGEPETTKFEINGRGYDVLPKLYPEYMLSPTQMNNLNVRTETGQMIPISNIIRMNTVAAPLTLYHYQQLRSATISANLAPGYTVGEGLKYLMKLSDKTLPKDTEYDTTGQSRQFVQASGGMLATFGFAIIFIFLILAAQFESFKDPLIVMTSVLLSITGALLTIHLTGGTLNIYTEIGLVTLIGLISKHGILMVEFANQLQEKGYDKTQAIIEAASLRLRPILMTTGAMLLGALPLIIATGAGSVSRSQLGWTVFGGMAFGTTLTLFVVPTFYSLLASLKTKPEEI